GVRHEPFGFSFPVTKRRCAAQRLSKLGADRDRGSYSLGNLFSFPLGHGGYHCVKESPGRRRRVYRLLERYKVGIVLAEDIGKIQKLPGVARKPGKLGKNQASDVTGLDV